MRTKEMSPEEVFIQFSNKMYNWNLMCIELDTDESLGKNEKDKKIYESLNAIFNEYVTIRKRPYGRQSGYSFKTPPEYNLETNEILSSTTEGNRAYIEVQETVGFKRKLRYTLHKKIDGWRVDKRESYDDVFKHKWEIDSL